MADRPRSGPAGEPGAHVKIRDILQRELQN